MDAIAGLTHWLDTLSLQLEPTQRRVLLKQIAQGLRMRMRDRIKQQRDPNAKQFTPRKRDQIGNIRRQGDMFQRIGTRIKTEYSASHAAAGFSGRDAMIARIHHEGRVAKPSKRAASVRYPRRELIGFSADDLSWLEQQISEFLAQA